MHFPNRHIAWLRSMFLMLSKAAEEASHVPWSGNHGETLAQNDSDGSGHGGRRGYRRSGRYQPGVRERVEVPRQVDESGLGL
ncbi:hypothetical protein Q0Z83_110990 [Actinoplanes sichuanensis]|nr:hypothetical protein Q0Z83_110990 [Actinoplanes sichuanensis]